MNKFMREHLEATVKLFHIWSDEDEDYFVQQSIWATVGWINCLLTHDIEPSDEIISDIDAMIETYLGVPDET